MTHQELSLHTEEEITEQLAEVAIRRRVRMKMSQTVFAERAGISMSSYRRFEQTGKISLESYLKVIRHLGLFDLVIDLLDAESIENIGAEAYVKANKDSAPQRRFRSRRTGR